MYFSSTAKQVCTPKRDVRLIFGVIRMRRWIRLQLHLNFFKIWCRQTNFLSVCFYFLIYFHLNSAINLLTFTHLLLFIDYVGFVKRLLTLMHRGYKSLTKLEIELTQLEKTTVKPVNQGIILIYLSFEL